MVIVQKSLATVGNFWKMFTEMIVWRMRIHANYNILYDFLKISKILQNLSEGQKIIVSVNMHVFGKFPNFQFPFII